jgi:hypothetical protein
MWLTYKCFGCCYSPASSKCGSLRAEATGIFRVQLYTNQNPRMAELISSIKPRITTWKPRLARNCLVGSLVLISMHDHGANGAQHLYTCSLLWNDNTDGHIKRSQTCIAYFNCSPGKARLNAFINVITSRYHFLTLTNLTSLTETCSFWILFDFCLHFN